MSTTIDDGKGIGRRINLAELPPISPMYRIARDDRGSTDEPRSHVALVLSCLVVASLLVWLSWALGIRP
jgi:hypothetical protein